jgi:hypothetical protein
MNRTLHPLGFLLWAGLAGSVSANIARTEPLALPQNTQQGLVAYAVFYPISDLDHLRVDDVMPVARLDVVHPGQARAAVVTYHGCQADIQGECSVSVSFHVVQPNGNTYDTPVMDAWPGADETLSQPPGATNLTSRYLSPAHLVMEFESDDVLGSYTLEARLIDHHSGQRVTARQSLWLVSPP